MNETAPTPIETTSYLTRPGGRIGYDVAGQGPLVVLVPGMGDLRSTFRFLAPSLRDAGYRVVSTDLRGQGDSDATFDAYGDPETAGDVVALLEAVGGSAVIVGNSMGAAAAVIVAAERPELVRGIVLIGPFVRNGKASAMQRLLQRVAMTPLWAAAAWKSYMPRLYAGRRPDDFEAFRGRVIASLHLPGHAKAFVRITRTSHDPAEARLGDVMTPTLVVMGEQDPDFPDPKAEAQWIAEKLHGEAVVVPEAGHYPQSQRPDVTSPAVLRFLATLGDGA
jgi:pimeloyl-ACP methyl ester carboxylesterase